MGSKNKQDDLVLVLGLALVLLSSKDKLVHSRLTWLTEIISGFSHLLLIF